MRETFLAMAVLFVLQGAALANTMGENATTSTAPQSSAVTSTKYFDTNETRVPGSLSEPRKLDGQRQVLSKNFSRSRPLRIYWFFGGR